MGNAQAAWTDHDIGDLAGRTAVVTGANSGIGFHTALRLAEQARMFITGREQNTAQNVITNRTIHITGKAQNPLRTGHLAAPTTAPECSEAGATRPSPV